MLKHLHQVHGKHAAGTATDADRPNLAVVELSFRSLDGASQLAWIEVLTLLLDEIGQAARMVVVADQLAQELRSHSLPLTQSFPRLQLVEQQAPLDAGAEFTMVSDSARLSLKLLYRFSRFRVLARAMPQCIDPILYWRLRSAAVSLDRFESVCKALGLACNAQSLKDRLRPALPRVALLTSVFDGDRFLAGFLENSAGLHGYEGFEHFLIRADSPGNEHAGLVRHVEAHPAAVYINLPADPGLYAVWNLAARLALSPYLSNANLDDRRAPEQLNILAGRLDEDPTVSVASAALRVAESADTTWEESAGLPELFAKDIPPVFGVERLFKLVAGQPAARNIPHCMPVWRRSLHCRYGYFYEPQYGPSADWEFWLRVGAAGVRFAHESRPLGLYLKRADSYWGVNTAVSEFDRLIIAQYQSLCSGRGAAKPKPKPIDRWPMGLRLRELDELATTGDWLALVSRLCACAQAVTEAGQAVGEVALLNAYAKQKLGVEEFAQWHQRQSPFMEDAPWRVVLGCLVESLHAHKPRWAKCHEATALQICSALVDWNQLTGDGSAFIGLALLARFDGQSEAEQVFLKHAHGLNGHAFWQSFQSVYRFEVELAWITAIVAPHIKTSGNSASPTNSIDQLWFYPDYTRTNAYQRLLYAGLSQSGASVEPLTHWRDIDSLQPPAAGIGVLHIHWVHEIVNAPARNDAQTQVQAFLDQVTKAKARGIRLYWTIHNALSHEPLHPQLERRLRQSLATLVDRVYVHHPIIPLLLGWLPADAPLWLCEHGPYPAPSTPRFGRQEAREALGIDQDDFVIIIYGGIKGYKALDRYLPVLSDIMQRNPRFKLLVAGRVGSDLVARQLELLPKEQLLLDDRFIPNLELSGYLVAADYAFLSYRSILTSGSLFHAFSMNLPVIAPALGTIPAYVINGWNGWTYSTPEGLRELLSVMLSRLGASNGALAMRDNIEVFLDRLNWQGWV